jgi:hypothetical protein
MNQHMLYCHRTGHFKNCIKIKSDWQSKIYRILITEEKWKVNILFLSFKER